MPVLYIDYSKCIGCETCAEVCSFMYGRGNIVMSRTQDGRVVPLYCRHCNNPGCMRACPRSAIVKSDDGKVLLQPTLCEGCVSQECLKGCPYLAIYPAADVSLPPTKCDMCLKQQEKGLLPACVSMCPCDALQLKNEDDTPSDDAKAAEKTILQHIKLKKAELFS